MEKKRQAEHGMGEEGKQNKEINNLQIPENIELFYIPPYTPEMNPIEQIWKEL